MNKIIVSAAAAVLLLSGSTAVFAQGASMSSDMPMDFASLDTDANGSLSLEEAQVAWPDLTQEQFEAADMNHDGALSEEESNSLKAQAGDTTDDATVPSTDQTNRTNDN